MGPAPPANASSPEPTFYFPWMKLSGYLHSTIPTWTVPDPGRRGRQRPAYNQGGAPLAPLSPRRCVASLDSTGRPPAQSHHSVVFTFHDSVIHPQDPVPFPKALVLGRGAWVHPAHHRPSPAQLLQVEAKTTAFLFAQQTETRPLQALEI